MAFNLSDPNTLVAFATFGAVIATLVTAQVIRHQTKVQSRAAQFQSYLGIDQIFEAPRRSEGIPAIRALRSYAIDQNELLEKQKDTLQKLPKEKQLEICTSVYRETYKRFLDNESADTRRRVYEAVTFLSTLSHLVSERYLDRNQAWSRYFFVFNLCYDRLYPWYIHGIREERHGGEAIAYATFERMCILVHQVNKWETLEGRRAKRKAKRIKNNLLKRQTMNLDLLEAARYIHEVNCCHS